MTTGAIGATPATGARTSSVTDADYTRFAQTLGVEQGQLRSAVGAAEEKAKGRVRELTADGTPLTENERDAIEEEMMDEIEKTLGLSNLTPEQKMALMELCEKCLADVEKEVAAENGVAVRGAGTQAANSNVAPANTQINNELSASQYNPFQNLNLADVDAQRQAAIDAQRRSNEIAQLIFTQNRQFQTPQPNAQPRVRTA